MTTPNTADDDEQQDLSDFEVPPADPAYATPPPEGLPDAEQN